MAENSNTRQRREWTRPQLKRLGSMRDIAGPRNAGFQSPTQRRS